MKLTLKILRWALMIFLGAEIILHIYNPFIRKNAADTYVLRPNSKRTWKDLPPGGDITFSTNSLGFRGSEPNDQQNKRIICMGGSTTQCPDLTDGQDWPALLLSALQKKDKNIWLNNAGVDGLKSSQYLKFFKSNVLPLKPKTILLMCGLDDVSMPAVVEQKGEEESILKKAYDFLEVPKTIAVLLNGQKRARPQDAIYHHPLNLTTAETMEMSDSAILQRIAREQPMVELYKNNLQQLADACKAEHIKLIIVSQAILFGDEKDVITNIDLGTLKTGDVNGKAKALLLKQYNKTSFDIAEKNNLKFVNVSARLPKDASFFYDGYHFTNDGSAFVSEIIYDEVKDLATNK